MDPNINLLEKEQIKADHTQEAKKAFTYFVIGLITAYLLVVIGIFSYQFYLNSRLNRTKDDVVLATSEIKSMADKELMTVLLTQKSESLKTILSNKKHHHLLANYLLNILPHGVSISGFTITEKNSLNFTGSADNLKALVQFLNNIKQKPSGNLILNQVVFKNLSLDRSEQTNSISYNFSIELFFLKNI